MGLLFTGIGALLSVSISIDLSRAQLLRRLISQATQGIRAGRGVLLDLFERIENIFRRLETYIDVPPTPGMMDVIVKVMVEVLCILGIATKEIKQNRASELIIGNRSRLLAYSFVFRNVLEETCGKEGY